MSVDYEVFQEGVVKEQEDLIKDIEGKSTGEEQDHSYQVMSSIPVLLKSGITLQIKSNLLRQYAEIQGYCRDKELSILSREDFYNFGKDMAQKEIKLANEKKTTVTRNYASQKDILLPEDKALLEKIDADHKVFKEELPNVIKSELGIPEDRAVGVREAVDFSIKTTPNNT